MHPNRLALLPLAALVACAANTPDGDKTGDTTATCAPDATCVAPVKACVGLVDNFAMGAYGLRLTELKAASGPFATSTVAALLTGALTPALPTCRLSGDGATNWILAIDELTSTVRLATADGQVDPVQGYTLGGASVQWLAKPDVDGKLTTPVGERVTLRLTSGVGASAATLFDLPISAPRLENVQLSADRSCIGGYNAAGLDASKGCAPDDTHPAFVTGGTLTGFISLEEADAVVVPALSESLCVLLTSDPDTQATKRCVRDSNYLIRAKGDWCSITNQAADGPCTDAIRVSFSFAAQSVKINKGGG